MNEINEQYAAFLLNDEKKEAFQELSKKGDRPLLC